MKVSIIESGKSNHSIPIHVWLKLLSTFIRMKYSKSGDTEPTISPVIDTQRSGKNLAGSTNAGCENVSGIY